jgi:hypothetical protein
VVGVRRNGRRRSFGSAGETRASSSFGKERAHESFEASASGGTNDTTDARDQEVLAEPSLRRRESEDGTGAHASGKSSRNHRFGGGKAEMERRVAYGMSRARHGRRERSLLRNRRSGAKARRRMTSRVAAEEPVFGRGTEQRQSPRRGCAEMNLAEGRSPRGDRAPSRSKRAARRTRTARRRRRGDASDTVSGGNP